MKNTWNTKKNNSNNVKTIVSMIFTHQARMRCFVRKTIEPIVDLMQTNEDDDYDDPIRNAIYSRPDYLDDYKKVSSQMKEMNMNQKLLLEVEKVLNYLVLRMEAF